MTNEQSHPNPKSESLPENEVLEEIALDDLDHVTGGAGRILTPLN